MIDETRPHVVMMVANDVSVDTRVRKMAHDLAAAGPRVTVLGLTNTSDREVAWIGKARIIRLPVSKLLRTETRSTLFPGQSRRYELIHRINSEQERFKIHQSEVGAKIGWLRRDYFAARARRRADENRREARRQNNLERRNQVLLSLIETAKTWTARLPHGAVIGGCWLLIKADRRFGSLVDKTRNRSFWYREQMRLKRMQATESRMRERLSKEHRAYERRVQAMRADLAKSAATDKRRLFRRAEWRDELPELHDYESAFGPALDELAPDVIHVHDVHLLGVGARAVGRAIVGGRDPTLVYDAHEYVQGLSRYSKRELTAWASLEREYIQHADRVITVSGPLAELLEGDYSLPEAPTVIMNIPVDADDGSRQIREVAGLDERTPLVVYSGGLDHARGIRTLVEAVGRLEGVHLGLVSRSETDFVRDLVGHAEAEGFSSRLHVVPFVQPHHVVSYLRSATAAVHPLVAGPINHEIALPNKIFEYMHAGLPMVVSNCRAMADLVSELGIGEVFESENVDSLVAKLSTVLQNIDAYRSAYESQSDVTNRFSWASQREKLFQIYEELLGGEQVNRGAEPDQFTWEISRVRDRLHIGIGPMNMAGQGWEWARALETHIPGLAAEAFEIRRGHRLAFPADVRIEGSQWRSLEWQIEWLRHITGSYSHVLLEGGMGCLGRLNGGRLVDDLPFLREHDVSVATVFHGSEIRNPSLHIDLVPDSPFTAGEELTERLIATAESNLDMLRHFDGPVFVSTLDLLDYVPDAIWLPQVVSLDRWQATSFAPDGPLRVLFVPTNSLLKGEEHVEALRPLADAGIIDLQIRRRVPTHDMPGLIASCDVLIDGVVLGLYGTTSVEGMASGKIVIANLSRVIDRHPEQPPIVHATPGTLESIVREVATNPGGFRPMAEAGPEYVRLFHDGRFAVQQLQAFLKL